MNGPRLAAALLLAAGLLLGLDGARRETPTVDEFAHLPAGCALLVHGSFSHYAQNPPLARVLMAIPAVLAGAAVPLPPSRGDEWAPWTYGQAFLAANRERYLHLFFLARIPMILVSLLGGFVLFRFAAAMFDETAGAGALLLYVLCPNLRAHDRLATTDAAAATAILAAFFFLYRYVRAPSRARLAVAGIALGVALLAKFSALAALPAFAVLLLLLGRRPLRRSVLDLAIAASLALVVLDCGYLFRGAFRPVGALAPKSALLTAAKGVLPAWLPVPLPRDFVEGFDAQRHQSERGEFGAYLAGRWAPQAPATYDAVALLVKLPDATLVLLVLGLFGAILGVRGLRAPARDELFSWLPAFSFLLLFGLFNPLKIGVRYLLPALPFLFLGLSRWFAAFRLVPHPEPRSLAAGAAALALTAASLASHPNDLAYFNAVSGGPRHGHEWLLDSNLDWGQDLWRVPGFLAAHGLEEARLLYFGHADPGLYGIGYRLPGATPEPGTYIVSANFAMGARYVTPDHGRMVAVDGAPAWLRAKKPVETIGRSLWVYRVD